MGRHAQEWISEVSMMIGAQTPVDVVKNVVHPFPTFSEILGVRLCGPFGPMADCGSDHGPRVAS
jgi:dihydrolipoamide dehydrogenase